VVLNLQPQVTLHEVLTGQGTLAQALVAVPAGFHVLLAGSGLVEYSRLTPELQQRLAGLIREAAQHFDVVLLDTGAGISDVVLYTLSLADEVLVVATPEPTSLTDAYATIKVLAALQQRRRLGLLLNQATRPGEGLTIAKQLQTVVDRYVVPTLGHALPLRVMGELPMDANVREAVRRRALVSRLWPGAEVSRALVAAADRMWTQWGAAGANGPSA